MVEIREVGGLRHDYERAVVRANATLSARRVLSFNNLLAITDAPPGYRFYFLLRTHYSQPNPVDAVGLTSIRSLSAQSTSRKTL